MVTKPGLHVRFLDGDVVVFDPETGCVHALIGAAALIWDELQSSGSQGLARRLIDRVDAPAATVDHDVRTTLDQLRGMGLVQPATDQP